MNELSFLIELLMNHKLPRATKELVAERIKAFDSSTMRMPQVPQHQSTFLAQQAPSTQEALVKHGLVPEAPVEVIAQTPATAAAMASRQQAIAESIAGKIDKTTGRPKKF